MYRVLDEVLAFDHESALFYFDNKVDTYVPATIVRIHRDRRYSYPLMDVVFHHKPNQISGCHFEYSLKPKVSLPTPSLAHNPLLFSRELYT